ncbi:hypothetical protein KEJ15_02905 [Candidatus Bathyarchaeota archaeon]|nr:hypothetical protein [Candidatus Bathyarchaeota archaeon]
MTRGEPEGKNGPKITELAAVVGVMVSILVAATSLLSNSGNLPSWWFYFSLILLIALTFFIPIMIFIRPVRERIGERRLERRLNGIARRYFPKLKDLVIKSRYFNNSVRTLMDNIRRRYEKEIKSQLVSHVLESHNINETYDTIVVIEKEIEESDKTYCNLCLLMKRFEQVLESYKRNLKIHEVFAHEIMTTTDKPITKDLEADYEAFREKYNDFLKDVTDFCNNINQETGRRDFPEHSFEYLKKL